MIQLPSWAADTPVTITRAGVTTDMGVTNTQDWSSPTTVETADGSYQPLDDKLAVIASALNTTASGAVFMTKPSVSLDPGEHRLTLDGVEYEIKSVRAWGAHLEVLVKEVR